MTNKQTIDGVSIEQLKRDDRLFHAAKNWRSCGRGWVKFIHDEGDGLVRVRHENGAVPTVKLSNLQMQAITPEQELSEFYGDLSAGGKLTKRALCHIKALQAEIDTLNKPAAQPQGEPVAYADPKSFENFATLAHLGGLYAHEWMWAERQPGLVALYAEQPQGEVERLRRLVDSKEVERQQCIEECSAEVGALRAQLVERDALLREIADLDPRGEFLGWQLDGKIDAILSASEDLRVLREMKADADSLGETLDSESLSELAALEAALSTSAEPKPRGEPVTMTNAQRRAVEYKEQQAFNDWALNKDGEAIGRMDGGSAALVAWHARAKLCAEQPAPLAIEAAKAFAKGFNTLEAGGGKYRINMQFQSREDAWGAFNMLARLKQLNTPQ